MFRRNGGLFVEVVVFSWIFNRNIVSFVDCSSKWWFFRKCFVEVVVFSWIFRRSGGFSLIVCGCGGFFVDFSSK